MPLHENENRKITYHFVDAINDESPFRNVSTAKLLDFFIRKQLLWMDFLWKLGQLHQENEA